ncbi:MAG: alpha-E domain-containing protein [Flavipsychrobacter sp.]|jgi:uncharacterized alpha-E superfamily protein|nr:alpha-E domain-containing protein [Flavipsychrobacter sp.]
MLSRLADSLYWLNRYLERSDAILRILHVNYTLWLDKGDHAVHFWPQLTNMFSTAADAKKEFFDQHPLQLVQHLIYDTSNGNSIRAMVIRARENARGAQDHITKEVWEQVNQFYHLINNPLLQQKLMRNDALNVLAELGTQMTLYTGITDSTMPRNMGWNFMTLGKFMERAVISIELADRFFAEVDYSLEHSRDVLFWRTLLLSLSGYELYLKTYRSPYHNQHVASQVLFSKQFTRSASYCFDRIGFYLEKVIKDNYSEEAGSLYREFGRLHSKIEYADISVLKEKGLQQYMQEIKRDLFDFNQRFSQLFFSYA